MKKLGMMMLVACCLLGCQQKENVETLEPAKRYTIVDQLEYEVIKSEVVKQINPTNKNQTYQYIKPTQEQQSFIDVIVNVKNLTDKEWDLSELMSGEFIVNKSTYKLELAIESVRYNHMSQTDTLKANEERYIHVYCEINDVDIENDATLHLKVLDQNQYTFTFSTEQTVQLSEQKSLGDILSLSESSLTIKAINQSDRVEPSVKGIFYSYIPADNEDETFIVLQTELKNISKEQIDPREYIYCEYLVGDHEPIKSRVIIESNNHKSLSQSDQIASGETRIVYLAMSVNRDLLKDKGIIKLFVEGHTFEIKQ